jgi:hypothetical protein
MDRKNVVGPNGDALLAGWIINTWWQQGSDGL